MYQPELKGIPVEDARSLGETTPDGAQSEVYAGGGSKSLRYEDYGEITR
jgi:hypothetical protein